jgi:hypothetical protein
MPINRTNMQRHEKVIHRETFHALGSRILTATPTALLETRRGNAAPATWVLP